MESRLIYISSEHFRSISSMHYEDWQYCGSHGEVKFDVVHNFIVQHFNAPVYYIAISRNDSFETILENLFRDIKDLIGLKDFLIWNTSFDKVIVFNKIGVFMAGENDRNQKTK